MILIINKVLLKQNFKKQLIKFLKIVFFFKVK